MAVRGQARGDITVEFAAKGDGDVTAAIGRVKKGQKDLGAETTSTGGRMTRTLRGLQKSYIDLSTAAKDAVAIASKAWDFVKEGARLSALQSRVDAIAGAEEKLNALRRGTRDTVSNEDLQSTILLMEQFGLTAQQAADVGLFSLVEAQRKGVDTSRILEQVTQALASGETGSLKAMGIRAKTTGEALRLMGDQGRDAIKSIKDGALEAQQAETEIANLSDDVAYGANKLWGVIKGFLDFGGAGEFKRRGRAMLDAEADALIESQRLIQEWGDKHADEFARARKALGDFLGPDSGLTDDRWLNTLGGLTFATHEWAGALRALGVAAADMRGPLSSGLQLLMQAGAAAAAVGASPSGAKAAYELAYLKFYERLGVKEPKKGGGRKRDDGLAAWEFQDRNERGQRAIEAQIAARQAQSGNVPGNVRRGAGPAPDWVPGQQFGRARGEGVEENEPSALDAFRAQMAAIQEWQDAVEGASGSATGFSDAMGDMWQAIGDATGSKRALAVLKGFKAASLAILAVEATFMGSLELARGLASLATPISGENPALHFAAAAAFFATAASKGAAIGALYGGGGGGGGGGGRDRSFTPPPDYVRQSRTEAPPVINVNITGPSLNSPEFRRVVTGAVRQGMREGQSTDPRGMY